MVLSGMKQCVGHITRFKRIWPHKAMDGARGDMACTKPMVFDSSMTSPF